MGSRALGIPPTHEAGTVNILLTGEGCLRVCANLQLEEVNAHSLEGPGDVGCRGPEAPEGTSQAPTVPPTPSQVVSASEKMNVFLLATDRLRPGRQVLANEK